MQLYAPLYHLRLDNCILFFYQISTNVSTRNFITVQTSSTSASTLAARTSVNVIKICIILMANAEVISIRLSGVTEQLSIC